MTPVMIGSLVLLALLILTGATFLYLTSRVEGDIGRSAVGVAEDVEEEASKENAQDKSNDQAKQRSLKEKANKGKKKKNRKNENRSAKPKASATIPATTVTSSNQGKVTALVPALNNINTSHEAAAAAFPRSLGTGSAFTAGAMPKTMQNVSGLGRMQQGQPRTAGKIRTFDPNMMMPKSTIVPVGAAATNTQGGALQSVSTAPLGSVMPSSVNTIAAQAMLPINQDLPTHLFTLPKAEAVTAENPYASNDNLKLCNRLKVKASELIVYA